MTKLSISKAWDEAKVIIAGNLSLLSTVALALFVLPGVIGDLVTPQTPAGKLPEVGYWTVVTAIAVLVTLIGQLAIIGLTLGSGQTVGEAIAHGARRAPAYIAATLLWMLPFVLVVTVLAGSVVGKPEQASLPAALGLLLLAAAMLVVAVRMLMTAPVASAEALGPIEILKRSWALTRGNWWRLFGFLLLFILAALILVIAVGSVVGLVAGMVFGELEPFTIGTLLVSLVGQMLSASAVVVFMVILARLYAQLAGAGEAVASVPSSGT